MNEFSIIQQYFNRRANRADVMVGIGDDAALVTPPIGQKLAITTDTLVAGVHFPLETAPDDIGYKALAVNLSDLAAMGATPAWVTLALTMPTADTNWLADFCEGFFNLADQYQIQLIGGDLTRGPLSITVQAMGFVPSAQSLRRDMAKVGDLIYVTGTLGDAGLALKMLSSDATTKPHQAALAALKQRLNRPEPRVAIGQALLGTAHAAIDISDGLAADLGHILEQSHVGATIYVDMLPLSEPLKKLDPRIAIPLALTAGDDYELCFTVPPTKQAELATVPSLTCIGKITQGTGLTLLYQDNTPYQGPLSGYEHF